MLTQKIPKSITDRIPELRGKNWSEGLMFAQALEGLKGKTQAAEFVVDHGEGKVPLALTGAEGEPLVRNEYVIVIEGGEPKVKDE